MFVLNHPQAQAFLAIFKGDPFNPIPRRIYRDWLMEEMKCYKAGEKQGVYADMIEKSKQRIILPEITFSGKKPLAYACFLFNNRIWYMMNNGSLRMLSPRYRYKKR